MRNTQRGPDVDVLADVVLHTEYKADWSFRLVEDMERSTEHLAGSQGLTLCVSASVPCSTCCGHGSVRVHSHEDYGISFESEECEACNLGRTNVEHWFTVPTAAYDRETWQRWVFDQVLLVEQHEAMEFFRVDGEAVFFPAHGVGRNPYTIERCR